MLDSREISAAETPSDALVRALRHVLRPLVHLLVARQITLPFLTNLLKGLFVEVAERDFPIAGKRQTDSRLSLLTGVHRKDIKRLRAELREGLAVPPAVSLGSQLVARWNADYADETGAPVPLPVQDTEGGGPSFEEFVASVSTDIRARSVLDEWLRLGVVSFDEHGRVALDSGVFAPRKGMEEMLSYFGRNLHDHIAAASHNVLGESPPFVERSVHYGELDSVAAVEIAKLAEETGMRSLREVNQRALELKSQAAPGEPKNRRIHFGIYFFEAPDDRLDTPDEGSDDA